MTERVGVGRPPGWLPQLIALVQLGRPKFLLGGLALYALGGLLAVVQGDQLNGAAYWVGQLAVTSIQLMTHYSNDYFDYHADRKNQTPTRWSGGSRILVDGKLPRSVALHAALVLAALAGGTILFIGFWPTEPKPLAAGVLTLMLVLAWSYSAPPLSLHGRGLGEPTVMVVVPLLTPVLGFVMQTGRVERSIVLLSVPLCLLQLVMLLTLEFPDAAGDRAVGKRSWLVSFGPGPVAAACVALIVLAFAISYASGPLGAPAGIPRAWLWLAPLGLLQLARMLARDWRRPRAWEGLCFGAVSLFFLAIVVDLVALYRRV